VLAKKKPNITQM